MRRFALAVDIGGTFTDVVLAADDGTTFTDKTLTTPGDLLEGFFRVADLALARAGIGPEAVNDVVVHATTVVTNSLIERKGPATGLLVTEGFRDVLYIREEHRYDMYDPQIEFSEPLIPRSLTFEVAERTYADGSVGKPVDREQIERLAEAVLASGVRSLAICLLNSYVNPANEVACAEFLARRLPDVFLSLSHQIAPQMREYPRASTTAINAFTQPITQPYLEALRTELARRGFRHEPLIMLSSGGIVGAEVAGRLPVRMIESGPAAGALVASYLARRLGIPDLLSFDMGGTTAKACLIQGGEPLVSGHFEVDRRYRYKPGSGMPVIVPSIDMIEIGSGGGSIGWIDELGLLKVGPHSAGSAPGPVCYGRGGTEPCVTDANVVLGILDPANFLGGDMPLDAQAAERALAALGDRLGVDARRAAHGMFEVVCEQMAAAARAHATDRGVDYRGLPLLAFGGAGPIHACRVAELLDGTTVVYPLMASVLSAFGTLVSPVRLDLVRGSLARLGAIDWGEVGELVEAMAGEGRSALAAAGIAPDRIAFSFAADLRYVGQQSEVTISLPGDPRLRRDSEELATLFGEAYEQLYGLRLDMPVETVSWRLTALGPEPDRSPRVALASRPASPIGARHVLIGEEAVRVPVYRRGDLAGADTITGPVIVEERETTIFVLPRWTLSVHESGTLFARRAA